ncbi:MAG: TlpA family protein disulfide reductase [Bryobacteraceae bacterium]|nr:TlpA family protein disulfide reductase [Bryobacteraceae bacterium]
MKMTFVWCLSVLAGSVYGQTGATCVAAPGVEAALDGIERESSKSTTPLRVRAEGLARLRAVFPGNLHVAMAELRWSRSTQSGGRRDEVNARYRGGPALLDAWSYIGEETPRAIAILTEIQREKPGMAWAEYLLGLIHTYPAFRDPERAAGHFKTFIQACPDALEGYEMLPRVALSPAEAARLAERLRVALRARKSIQALRLWPVLWTLEFKGEVAEARERVRTDVAALEGWTEAGLELDQVRLQAARLTGETAVAKALQEKLDAAAQARANPPSMAKVQEWLRANPEPAGFEEQARQAWAKRGAAFFEAMAERESAGVMPLTVYARWLALDPGRPVEQVREAGEQALALLDPEQAGLSPSNYYRIVEAWMERRALWGRIPELLDRARSIPPPGYRASDLVPQSVADEKLIQRTARLERGAALLYRAELAHLQGELMESERHFGEFAAILDEERTPEGTTAPRGDMLPVYEGMLYETRARIAIRARDWRAAALWRRRAAAARRFTPTAPPDPRLLESALALWKHGGGTGEEWAGLPPLPPGRIARVEAKPRERDLEQAFPAFAFTDVAGRAWTPEALRGRPVLVNLWATWCGPCRLELPHLEKLHREVSASGAAVVLTLNIDDNPGVVAPFMAEQGYTFPVVAAQEWVEKHLPGDSVPRTLLLDSEGLWRKEILGFDGTRGDWVAAMKAALAGLSRPR